MAETPADGVRRPATSRPVEVADEESSTNVSPPPQASTRHSLSLRRITNPSFMLDLREGSPVGEYEIEAQIGEGAMGTVYSAIHPLIGKKVAVKVLKRELCANQDQVDRFVREAQAVNKIGHPNIVDVFMLGELPDGRAYFVMEWLRGEDLKTRLARGPMTVADACDILDGIARALDAAHGKEIVHRDLKPDNVFLHQVDNGPLMVKLLDFGIAKLVKTTPGTERTNTGSMLGTPRYVSPEQARGIHVDYRSDIYSLGVMAYEMLAGRPPFQGETAMDLVVQHLSEPAPALSQFAKVPKSLEDCVMRMLAKDPQDRPSLADVRSILLDPSRRLTPLPSRIVAVPGATTLPARARWPLILAAIVGAAGLGVLTWTLVGRTGDRPQASAERPQASAERPQASGLGPRAAESSSIAAAATVPAPAPAPAPVTAPAPVPARGTLDIKVSGAKDALILVDSKEWGRGEAVKVELDAGGHEVEVRAPGRSPIQQHVELGAGQANTIAIVVPPATHVPARGPRKEPVRKTLSRPTSGDDDELLRPGHR